MVEESSNPNDENLPDEQNSLDSSEESSSEVVVPKKPRIELGERVFGKMAIWIVVVPFVVYMIGNMIGGYIENTLRKGKIENKLHHFDEGLHHKEEDTTELYEGISDDERFMGVFKLKHTTYPYTYVATIGLTVCFILPFSWGYFRAPFKISPLSVVVGVVGVVVWIGLEYLDRNSIQVGQLLGGKLGDRPSFNPFEDPSVASWMWPFISIRFFGLVLLIPLIEEFFLRGFLMRYVDDPDWDQVPLGVAMFGGWISPTIYGAVAHPGELFSALAWFSMVTWLYRKTGSIWDCVVAHAVTNLLLGIYIVQTGTWHLW